MLLHSRMRMDTIGWRMPYSRQTQKCVDVSRHPTKRCDISWFRQPVLSVLHAQGKIKNFHRDGCLRATIYEICGCYQMNFFCRSKPKFPRGQKNFKALVFFFVHLYVTRKVSYRDKNDWICFLLNPFFGVYKEHYPDCISSLNINNPCLFP